MMAMKPKRILTGSSILFKISLLVTVLCGIIMLYASYRLYLGWTDYRQAKELQTIQAITSPFTDALKNFMFERGRMNVILSAGEPISADNRSFINERRKASDKSFAAGFSLMNREYPREEALLRKGYHEISLLRAKMDEEALKPLQQRDPQAQALWYANCTDYIDLVSSTLAKISGLSRNNGLISNYNELILDTLHFRGVVGSESSIFTAALAKNKPLGDEDYAALLLLRGESKQVWSDIENKVAIIDSDHLTAAAKTVKEKYYGQFRPFQDELLALALKGRVQEGADKEIAKLSVPALDSVLLLADEAIKGIRIENEKNMKKGYNSLLRGVLELFAGILVILIIPAYLKTRLIRPLNKIVELIANLGSGKTDIENPFMQRKDEIGKLANGVELLQQSIEEEQTLKLELQQTIVKLEELSIKDSLTGLYNRRYILQRINELENSYKKSKSAFSIIIGDIDCFKAVNDRYGHDCGDFVLCCIAKTMSACCRAKTADATGL
jgi:HAMP domain-containing protein